MSSTSGGSWGEGRPLNSGQKAIIMWWHQQGAQIKVQYHVMMVCKRKSVQRRKRKQYK